jgi:hypothetical protein
MDQSHTQPPPQSSSREVNHTIQWPPSHPPYSPSYPWLFSGPTYPNHHQGPSPSYYQSYNYATTNHTQPSPLPQLTYPSPLPHITYPMRNNSTHQNNNLPPPLLLQTHEPLHQNNNFPTHRSIHTITEASNVNFKNKKQRRDYYHQVNHVAIEGTVIKTKWSHMSITFSIEDINLAFFPHTDAIVITVHIDRWDVTRILIDNSSQAEVLFLSAFDKMGYDKRKLKEPTKPLYSFDGKRIKPVGVITLPISFGTQENPRTEYITFDVVDMHYPYNAIFRRGLLNTFKVALHSGYLCLKVPATFRIISVFGNQKDARNIE